MQPQYAERVAIAQWNQLAAEERGEADAFRRACLQGQFCERLSAGMTRTDAAIAVGVARSSVYRWLKEEPGFLDAANEAELVGAPLRLPPQTGKPSKMGARVRQTILHQLQEGGSRGQAAEAAGVSRQTFYTWFKRYEDFRDAVLAAEARAR